VQAVAAIKAGHNIYIQQFVGALLVVSASKLLGVTHNSKSLEMDTLNETRTLNVKTWDQANPLHGLNS
jgi:hypothetical protein